MSKKQNIKLLLELDDLVRRESNVQNRIDELRALLKIEIAEKVVYEDKKIFPVEQYCRLKAFGMIDIECAFLLNVHQPEVSVFRNENQELIQKKVAQYKESVSVSRYKKRIARGIK